MESPAMENNQWKSLLRIAGISAVIMVIFIPIQMAVFTITPPPSTVTGWFSLFQKNALVGLIDMDLLLIIDQVFMGLIFLALYQLLKRHNSSYMAIALILAILGIAAYFASTVAFEMLSLSNQYTAADTETDKSVFLAAGRAMMATWQGTAFNVGYVLEAIALLLVSFVMLRSDTFNKTISYVGIILGVMSLVPPTVPTIGMFFAIGSLIPLVIWSILLARRFFQLSGH